MITILSTILNTISILLWMHLLGNIEYRHKHPTILVLILSLSVAIINYILPSVVGVFSGILLLCISAQILFCGKWWTLCIHTLFAYFYVEKKKKKKSYQVRSSQPPVPSPWNRNGNIRFKRRTGSNRAETKVK